MSKFGTLVGGVVWGVGVQLLYLWAFILLWCTLSTELWSICALVIFVGFGTALEFLRTTVPDVADVHPVADDGPHEQ